MRTNRSKASSQRQSAKRRNALTDRRRLRGEWLEARTLLATDVMLSVPNQSGMPGAHVSVPIDLSDGTDNLSGSGEVGAVQVVVRFDPTVLTANSGSLGSLLNGWTFTQGTPDNTDGEIYLQAFSTTGLGGSFSGAAFSIGFTVAAGATGSTNVSIASTFADNSVSPPHTFDTEVDDETSNPMTLNPVPTNSSNDPVAGTITVTQNQTAVALSVPNSSGAAGSQVSVPIDLSDGTDNLSGSGEVGAVQVVVRFDPTVLTANTGSLGSLLNGWTFTPGTPDNTDGEFYLQAFSTTGLGGNFSGAAFSIDFTIKAGATGSTTVSVASTFIDNSVSPPHTYDTEVDDETSSPIALNPAPTNAANDPVAGTVTVSQDQTTVALSVPNSSGAAGSHVSVPIDLSDGTDNLSGSGEVGAVQVVVRFDPTVLTANMGSLGSLLNGWTFTPGTPDNTDGEFYLQAFSTTGLGGNFSGAAFSIDFTIKAGATGSTTISVASTFTDNSVSPPHTYDSEVDDETSNLITLNPAPTNASNDPVAGTLTIAAFVATGQTISPTEGESFSGQVATVIDTGATSANLTASIAWGDGTTTAGTVTTAASGGFVVNGSHTYAEEGTQAVTVTVTDNTSGKTATATGAAQISDPAVILLTQSPTATAGNSSKLNLLTFTDPGGAEAIGDYGATINWGDGATTTGASISLNAGVFTVSGVHTYASAGIETSTVTVTHDSAPMTSATVVVNVVNEVINPTALAIVATEGATFSGSVASFTDTNSSRTSDDFTASINWGDGTTTTGAVTAISSGGFAINGTHLYAEEGTHSVAVTITSTSGITATTASTANIADAPLHVVGVNITATGVVTITGGIATFTDADPAGTAADYSATIDWGDHTSLTTISGSQITVSEQTFNVAASHVYNELGTYTATVTVSDVGGSSQTTTDIIDIVSVHPPAPTANPDTFVLGPSGFYVASGATSVLANDTSADGQPQNLVATLVSATTNGTVTLNPDGSFIYTPGATFQGIGRFTYQVSEGTAVGNTVTVTLLSYNASLVDKLYQQVLHRSAEDSGLIYWTGLLDQGQPLDVVATGIFDSTERLDPLVTQFYEQYLNRDTDPSGLAYWVGIWQQTGDPRDVVENILASPEFYSDAGSTNIGFIELLYQRVLNRAYDSAGLNYWLGLMSSPTNEAPLQIASQFYDTHEKHGDLVNFLFGEYFQGVTPLPDTTPYVTDLDDGETETEVEKAIIDSSAYSSNPPEPAAGSVGRALYPH